jgi:hypothetical protein
MTSLIICSFSFRFRVRISGSVKPEHDYLGRERCMLGGRKGCRTLCVPMVHSGKQFYFMNSPCFISARVAIVSTEFSFGLAVIVTAYSVLCLALVWTTCLFCKMCVYSLCSMNLPFTWLSLINMQLKEDPWSSASFLLT